MRVHPEPATFIPDAIDLSVHHRRHIHASTVFTPDAVDPLICADISLPRGPNGEADIGCVVPTLDSFLYEVHYSDGHCEALFANTISANLYSQLDEEGNHHEILDDIIDHRQHPTFVLLMRVNP
jgi:hypothetical protein